MIDGVKCSCIGLDANLWRNNPLLDFGLSVSETTGEILTNRREAKVKSLTFILSPSVSGSFSCSFAGSLHKYKNINGNNWNDFTFTELTKVLNTLSIDYKLDLQQTAIHTIEIGVNTELDFSPEIILKSVICHKGKSFDRMDRRDKRLGLICEHTDYAIKLYDKGYQCKLAGKYILRYELRLFRQRMLEPFEISTLADLKNAEKVAPLVRLLLERLNEIVFFDFKFKPANLSKSKQLSWNQYSNPKYWESLNYKQYGYARQRYADLIKLYNCIDWMKFVSKQVVKKWLFLTGAKQINLGGFPQLSNSDVSTKFGRFSKLEYLLEFVPTRDNKKREKNKLKTDERFCISCGRQITEQKKGSRFCSEKLYGKEARQCRNKDSNRRLTIKRKMKIAMSKNLMIRIVYTDDSGNEYADILGANEIHVTREWLDKVVQVEVLKEPQPETLTGDKAKDYLLTININNNETID